MGRIVVGSTRRSAVRLRGQISASAGDPSPITGSLVGEALPQLHGNVVTELKPGAEAALLGQDLLARGWGGEDDEPSNRQDLTDREPDPADLQPDPA